MTAAYRFLSVDLVSGTIRDEIPFESVTFGRRANGAAKFSASANAYDPKITEANLDAARTLIVVERNGKIVGDGIVWNPTPKREGDARLVDVKGASLFSYLDRRRIREDREYSAVDDAEILADLVGWAQGGGSLSYGDTVGDPTGDVLIDTATATALGRTSDRTYRGDERKPIGEAVTQLAFVEGLDVEIGLRWDGSSIVRELLVREARGVDLADAFALGTNVTDYELPIRGDLAETHVEAIGQGEGRTMLVSTAADPSAHPSYPRLDGVESHKDVSQVATLDGHAAERLARHSRPPRIPKITLDPSSIPTFGSWRLWDRARVVIDDGYAQVDGIYVVVAWEMTVDANGDENIDVTMGRALG